jgi:adenylate cyclase class 2
MNTEFELRVLEVNPADITAKMEQLGCSASRPRTLMRRYTFDTIPKLRDKWMRLRDDGQNVKLAIKHVRSHEVHGTKEIEVTVDDFDKTLQLIRELGINEKSYQENYRTVYELNHCEVSIDEWPLIPPFLEVEGPDAETVSETLQQLGFDLSDATGEDISTIFEKHYGIDIDAMPILKF